MQAFSKRLNLISLLQLDNWSVQTLLEFKVKYSNRLNQAKIGDFLIKNRHNITVEDHIIYKRVTVKINNNGVTLRDTEKGINIGTKKQFVAKKGQFIISKIDARNGAFGIIPSELDGAIVTNDFPVFDVNDKRINAQFLLLITTTKQFIQFAQSCSSGTTNRQRMDIDLFLNQKIPLPTIAEQNSIVENWNKKNKDIQDLQIQIKLLETKVEAYLNDKLGVSTTVSKNIDDRNLRIVSYNQLEKWSFEDIFNKNGISSTKYQLVSLNTVCSKITDGTHQTPKYVQEGITFLSAKNVTKEVIDWENVKYVTREAHEEYIKRVKPEMNDIILAKNGTTGVAAIVDSKNEFSIYVSLALLKPITSKIYPLYLLYIINSEICRLQFSSRLIGIGVPNLHLGEIREVEIPLPALQDQINIANQVTIFKHEIIRLKKMIVNLKSEIESDFSISIFS
jgi:type I restriction enzyme S subunit